MTAQLTNLFTSDDRMAIEDVQGRHRLVLSAEGAADDRAGYWAMLAPAHSPNIAELVIHKCDGMCAIEAEQTYEILGEGKTVREAIADAGLA